MTTILAIEDETPILENILGTIELGGYDAKGAPNGRLGVDMARQHMPDLIVCDILMPELDGYGVLLELRNDPATAMIPFIFLTAKASRDDMRQGMGLGADDYISKPFTPDELLAAVNARLERRASLAKEYERQLNELRGHIVHMLPHELRTPLSSILGYSELLMLGEPTMARERVVEMAHSINRSARRLHRLVENFLIYAQIEIIGVDPDRVAALRSLRIAQPRALIEFLAHEKAQEYRREADLQLHVQEVPVVRIVKDNLQKIVTELVDNAFKFSKAGTPVHVGGVVEGNNYLLRVTNMGRGMTPEQIAAVGAYTQFERKIYEQQGTGLGLIIAKRLADLHQGALTIESTPGQTTTVSVTLPLS